MTSRVLRWLMLSAAAAATAALAAGGLEAWRASDARAATCAAAFTILAFFPLLFVIDIALRGVWRAWRVEGFFVIDRPVALRRDAWIVVLLVDCGVLAVVVCIAVRFLGAGTAFTPLLVSFVMPAVTVITALLLLAVARPLARVIDTLLRGSKVLTTRRVVVGLALACAITAAATWFVIVHPALGPLDLGVLAAPLAALLAGAAVHVSWQLLPRSVWTATTLSLCALLGLSTALFRYAEPDVVLSVWGDMPVAGFVIDAVCNLEAVRNDIPQEELRPGEIPGAPHPDIIIITIDTVRADHTPPYGGHAEMPVLAQLAQHGTVFEWAFSPSNVTRRSIPSMMIGLQPNRVHGRVVGWALRVDPRHIMLAERMRAAGYDTAGFMCCDGFWGKKFHTGLGHGLEHLEIDHNGLALARKAHAWLDQREHSGPHRPLFLWMHILEPHNWGAFGAEPRTDAERKTTYDRALSACDGMLQEITSAFSGRAPGTGPIIIVTADHGEGLGEHGHPFHSTDLYDSQTHIPLVIEGPGINRARVGETVSLTDLAPTVLELAGYTPPPGAFDGQSFASLATGRRPANADGGSAFSAMIYDRSNPGGITSIVAGRWKLINDHGTFELYDTRADPDEHANRAAAEPAVVSQLKAMLAHRVAAGRQSPFVEH